MDYFIFNREKQKATILDISSLNSDFMYVYNFKGNPIRIEKSAIEAIKNGAASPFFIKDSFGRLTSFNYKVIRSIIKEESVKTEEPTVVIEEKKVESEVERTTKKKTSTKKKRTVETSTEETTVVEEQKKKRTRKKKTETTVEA